SVRRESTSKTVVGSGWTILPSRLPTNRPHRQLPTAAAAPRKVRTSTPLNPWILSMIFGVLRARHDLLVTRSRNVDVVGLRLHAAIGGCCPPCCSCTGPLPRPAG